MDQAVLFQLVPEGEENAVPARMIWKTHGIGAAASTKQALNQMAFQGLIERKKVHIAPNYKIFYFRKPDRRQLGATNFAAQGLKAKGK
jgi:hypothetical protein